MTFEIEHKLVIGVASSALFDLTASHQVYLDSGPDEYRRYQERNLDVILGKGVAFPFIRRFLNINKVFPRHNPVEVVLFSRNSPETGLRVMRSIAHYGLDISRAAFITGKSPYTYLPAFNAALFLSANEEDVKSAIAANYPAGLVLPSKIVDDDDDIELRVAFDFDGVIADDESETIFKRNNDLNEFHAHETLHMAVPHQPGPLAEMFKKLSLMQRLEERTRAKARPGLQEGAAHCHHHRAQRAISRTGGHHAQELGRVGQRDLLFGRDEQDARAVDLQAAYLFRRPADPFDVLAGRDDPDGACAVRDCQPAPGRVRNLGGRMRSRAGPPWRGNPSSGRSPRAPSPFPYPAIITRPAHSQQPACPSI